MGEATKSGVTTATDQQHKRGRPGGGDKAVFRAPSSLASEDAEVKVPNRFYRRKAFQIGCAVTTVVLLALLIIILVLVFTLFKTKNPVITVTGMTLESVSVHLDSSLTNLQLDVSLHLNVSVRNPNAASFKYQNSTTYLFYREKEVGSAPIPAGMVGARKTVRFETDLDIRQLRLPVDANLTADAQSGIIPVSTYSAIRGRLNVINIFKHNAVSTSDCNAKIFVMNATLEDFHCAYAIKI